MTDADSAPSSAVNAADVGAAIRASLERRDPLVVLTGASGVGKTALYRSVLAADPRIAACVVLNPFLTFHDLLKQIVADLAGDPAAATEDDDLALAATEHDLIRMIQRCVRPGQPTLIVIDDAHLINLVVLSKLRALLNLSFGDRGLTVLLVGQPLIEQILQRAEFRSVLERTAAVHRLGSPPPSAIVRRPMGFSRTKPSSGADTPRPAVFPNRARRGAQTVAITAALTAVAVAAVMMSSGRQAPVPDVNAAPPPAPQPPPALAPPEPSSALPASTLAAAPTPRASANRIPAPPRDSPPAPEPRPPGLVDTKLAAWRQETERRAQILARKGDVKGLLALQSDVAKRFQQLGGRDPVFLAAIMEALAAQLDQARAIRLHLDAEAFRR